MTSQIQAPKKGPKELDEDDKAFLEKKKAGEAKHTPTLLLYASRQCARGTLHMDHRLSTSLTPKANC